jgi:hypothetical protein
MVTSGWSNKKGTSVRSCYCGDWKQHWINYSGKSWPSVCSVSGCSNKPTLGAHVINASVSGEKIVPMCDSCNGKTSSFNLRDGVTLVSANVSETCGINK